MNITLGTPPVPGVPTSWMVRNIDQLPSQGRSWGLHIKIHTQLGSLTFLRYYNKKGSCQATQPGGYCPGVVPNGNGTCTWNYEEAGADFVPDETGTLKGSLLVACMLQLVGGW